MYIFFLSHSFAPTPKLPDIKKFEFDLLNWFNKLRWRYFYAVQTTTSSIQSKETIDLERALITDRGPTKNTKSSSPAL